MAEFARQRLWWMGAALLWALVLWDCLWWRGLFVDGHGQLVGMMQGGGYDLFYDARANLMAMTQTPAALAIRAGVTDSELLSRLLSLGLFGVPACFYAAALVRARHDPALLAAVFAALGLVFVPTSFFIMGEHNSICAVVVFAAVVLATARRVEARDGLMLLIAAFVLLRSHEATALIGPLMAVLTGWRLFSLGARPWPISGGVLVWLVALLLFAGSAPIALDAIAGFHDKAQVQSALGSALAFADNMQFMLPLVALALLALAALVRPRLLETRGLYVVVGLVLVLAALMPLLWLGTGDLRPFPKSHYGSRLAAFGAASVIAIVVVAYASPGTSNWPVFAALHRPTASGRVAWFAAALFAASLPADLLLTELWRRTQMTFQRLIGAQSGFIPYEQTVLAGEPYRHFNEYWLLPQQSLVLRRRLTDGTVIAPKDFTGWQNYEPTADMPGVFRFYWGGGDGR